MVKKNECTAIAKLPKPADYITRKQKRFIAEYLIDYRISEAAHRAGYCSTRAKKLATALLDKAHIKTYLEEQIALQTERNNVTKDYFVLECRKIVEGIGTKNNDKVSALTLLAKITGHIKEVSSDQKQVVILQQTGLNDQEQS